MERDQSSSPLISPKTKEVNNNNDRLKRDEWSEGAVSCLLEAYETKWVLRNRAKLKGQDWEDVAKHVSSRTNNSKSAKTQTQCKNKIESMKKRYRSESVSADVSSWPLYSRLDLLLRGNTPLSTAPNLAPIEVPVEPSVPPVMQKKNYSNGVDDPVLIKGDVNNNICGKSMEKEPIKISPTEEETNSSTPDVYRRKEKLNAKSTKVTMKKRKREDRYLEIGESIRWVAEMVVKSEQARMETMQEIERMRAEAEAKREEMNLKRIEIIANTQLEIAKLFTKGAGGGAGGGLDSSLRIGRT